MKISKPKGTGSSAPEPVVETKKPGPSGFSLPVAKSEPVSSIGSMSFLIYGEKKIGKTSIAAQFPKALFLAFEKGYSGLSIFVEPMFDKNEKPDWRKFVAFIDLLVKENHDFETVVLDTIDVAYSACMDYVCMVEGWEHPSDGAYGKGWKAVEKEFSTQIGRLVNCPKFGTIFLSHAVEKEFLERTGGKYDKIIASMPDQARKLISAVCDCIVFYGYHGEQRLLTIRGSDSVESGTRMTQNFWIKGGLERHQILAEKKRQLVEQGKLRSQEGKSLEEEMATLRVHSIPAGADEQEAYFNFQRAFNNQQEDDGKPEFDFGYIEKKAPMKNNNTKETK